MSRARTHVTTPSAAAFKHYQASPFCTMISLLMETPPPPHPRQPSPVGSITMDCRRTMDLARFSSSASMALWVACCLRLSRSCTTQHTQLLTIQCRDLCKIQVFWGGLPHYCTHRFLHADRHLHGYATTSADLCLNLKDSCRDLLQAFLHQNCTDSCCKCLQRH